MVSGSGPEQQTACQWHQYCRLTRRSHTGRWNKIIVMWDYISSKILDIVILWYDISLVFSGFKGCITVKWLNLSVHSKRRLFPLKCYIYIADYNLPKISLFVKALIVISTILLQYHYQGMWSILVVCFWGDFQILRNAVHHVTWCSLNIKAILPSSIIKSEV